MRTKEIILQQLKELRYVDSFHGFTNDREVAFAAIQTNPLNFHYFPKFNNDKEIFLELIVPRSVEILEYVSQSLKNNENFALEVLKINKDAIRYFSKKVQFSFNVLEKVINDSEFYTNHIYSQFLYNNHKEQFIEYFKNDEFIYQKLPAELKINKELMLLRFNNHSVSSYEYFDLSDSLRSDFDITFSFLQNTDKKAHYFEKVVKSLHQHMYDEEKMIFFIDTYNGPFCKEIINLLIKNKTFKKDFYDIYKNNPKCEDYKPFIREKNLFENLNEIEKEKIQINYKRPKI